MSPEWLQYGRVDYLVMNSDDNADKIRVPQWKPLDTMLSKFLLAPVLLIYSSQLLADLNQTNLLGTWVSKGEQEIRTLSFSGNSRGQFMSEHPRGSCGASLDTTVNGQFIIASGLAPHCQRRNNSVAFEFYCQQTAEDELRCQVRSRHQRSGGSKQGVENFRRKLE